MNTEIDQLLKAWKVDVEVPVRFQAGVWESIAMVDAAREQSLLHRFATRLSTLLLKPQYATAVALLAVFIGLSTASIAANSTNSHRWTTLENRYAVSIDPIAMANRGSAP